MMLLLHVALPLSRVDISAVNIDRRRQTVKHFLRHLHVSVNESVSSKALEPFSLSAYIYDSLHGTIRAGAHGDSARATGIGGSMAASADSKKSRGLFRTPRVASSYSNNESPSQSQLASSANVHAVERPSQIFMRWVERKANENLSMSAAIAEHFNFLDRERMGMTDEIMFKAMLPDYLQVLHFSFLNFSLCGQRPLTFLTWRQCRLADIISCFFSSSCNFCSFHPE